MVDGILFAVWQETVRVRIIQDHLLPWMTVETPEQRQRLRMTSRGLAWDGHRLEIPGGAKTGIFISWPQAWDEAARFGA